VHPRIQDSVRVTVIATGLKDAGRSTTACRRAPQSPPPPPARDPEPRSRLSEPPARERDRERDVEAERPRRPAPAEWERGRPRADPRPVLPPAEGDDDYEVPAFLRRP